MPRRLLAAGLSAAAGLLAAAAPASATVNDFTCVPRAGRAPVVLVHGTFLDSSYMRTRVAPQLEADGFCVFDLDYGNNATAPMAQSADAVAEFARRVLAATRAPKLSFIGHSQGGSLSRYVVKFRGLGGQVQDVVGLAPSSHGTTQPLAGPLGSTVCPACGDQVAGSPLMQELNAAPEAPATTDWTVVTTKRDEVVTPYGSQALTGATVTNVLLQDACPGDQYEHVGIIYDPVAIQWTRNALLRPGPANPRFVPDCSSATLGTDPDPAAPAAAERTPSAQRPALVLGRRALVRGRRILLAGTCRASGALQCVSHVVVRLGSRRIGALRATLAGGSSQVLRVPVSAADARRLKQAGTVRLRTRATTQGGSPRATSRTYVVRG